MFTLIEKYIAGQIFIRHNKDNKIMFFGIIDCAEDGLRDEELHTFGGVIKGDRLILSTTGVSVPSEIPSIGMTPDGILTSPVWRTGNPSKKAVKDLILHGLLVEEF